MATQASGASDTGLNLPAGQTFAAPIDADASDAPVFVIRPGETSRQAAGNIEPSTRVASLRFEDTEQAGVYHLFVGDEARPHTVFAVQSDPAESDFAPLPAADLTALNEPRAEPTKPAVAAPTPTLTKAPAARVPGPELWAAFALAALVAVLLELALAHYFSRVKI
jgi:hypothetical protein